MANKNSEGQSQYGVILKNKQKLDQYFQITNNNISTYQVTTDGSNIIFTGCPLSAIDLYLLPDDAMPEDILYIIKSKNSRL